MDSKSVVCDHRRTITAENHVNCALCNAFASHSDGHFALKDSSLGGMHQTFPQAIFQRLLAERRVLALSKGTQLSTSYMKVRKLLVDWLRGMRAKLGLSEGVLHVAVKYMDYILAQKDYHSSKYQLIALCCLTIAAKYDELDRNIPFPEDFTRQAKLPFRTAVLTECEMLLLKILDWQLKVATVYEVALCLLSQGVLFDDDLIVERGHKIPPREEHAALLTKTVKYMVSNSLRGTNSSSCFLRI